MNTSQKQRPNATVEQRGKAITFWRIDNDVNGNPRFAYNMLLQDTGNVMLPIIDSKLAGRYSKRHQAYVVSTYMSISDYMQQLFNEYWGKA